MAIRGATKRKPLGQAQETKQPKSKKLKAKLAVDVGGEEDGVYTDEDIHGRGLNDEYNDHEDIHSQQEMIVFERKLKEMKKRKKTRSDNSTLKFKKKVKDNEESLINSLHQKRLEVKHDAFTFSDNLTLLLEKALDSSFSEVLTYSPLDLAQDGQSLHESQISTADISRNLIVSTRSLQDIITKIVDKDLMIGEGWEQDGDLCIGALREAQQSALLKLTEAISRNTNHHGGEGGRENASETNWGDAVGRAERGIKGLLKNVPISADDIDEK